MRLQDARVNDNFECLTNEAKKKVVKTKEVKIGGVTF